MFSMRGVLKVGWGRVLNACIIAVLCRKLVSRWGGFVSRVVSTLVDAAGRGLPGGKSLSLVRTRERNQRETAPAVCVPALRYGQPVVLSFGGVQQNSLRSNSCWP